MDQFINLKNLIGEAKLLNRHKSSVVIVGIGGVGSWAAEALIRSGVGKITLIDLDDICISNSNRQLHTLKSTIGLSKVQTMQVRLKDINPEAEIIAVSDFLTCENMPVMISNSCYVIDAIDSLKIKCSLIAHCFENKIPLVTTGGAAGKSNPQLVEIKDLAETHNDGLLQRVRKKLRMKHNFPKRKKQKFGITVVYSPEPMDTTHSLVTPSSEVFCDTAELKSNCSNGIGTCVTVTASFGLLTSYQILKLIDAEKN